MVGLVSQAYLRSVISEYYEATGSSKAKRLLDDWQSSVKKFWQVVPPAEASNVYVKEVGEAAAVKASA